MNNSSMHIEKDEVFVSKETLMKRLEVSASFVNKILDEMRIAGIYGEYKIRTPSWLRINKHAFMHYLRNRDAIKHGRKYEPYVEVKI